MFKPHYLLSLHNFEKSCTSAFRNNEGERFKGERRRPHYLVSLDTLGKTSIIVKKEMKNMMRETFGTILCCLTQRMKKNMEVTGDMGTMAHPGCLGDK